MNKKNFHTLSPLVLLSLLSFLSLLTPLPVQAQAYRLIPGDVLTFEGGAEDSNMPDVYVVDITNTPAAGSTIPFVVNRPKGA